MQHTKPFATTCVSLSSLILALGCAVLQKMENPNTTSDKGTAGPKLQSVVIRKDQGTIWLPFSVTIKAESGEMPANESFALRNMSLVITNARTLKEHLVPLETINKESTRNLLLSPTDPERTFFTPRIFSLPEGQYILLSIAGERSIPGARTERVSIPLPPFPNRELPHEFTVRNGLVSPLPRMATMISISGKHESPSFRVQLELKDSEFIPLDIVLANLGLDNTQVKTVLTSDDDSIKQRLSLSTKKNSFSSFAPVEAQVGFLFDAPCDLEGIYRLVWKRSGDVREYVSSLDLSKQDPNKCSNSYSVPLVLNLPQGTWNLLSTNFGPKSVNLDFKFPPHWERSSEIKQYFSLENPLKNSSWSGGESDIKRKISFVIPKSQPNNATTTVSMPFLYAGRFSITTKTKDGEKGITIATAWDRRFSLEELRKVFEKDQFLNAYSQAQLVRDQTKSEVQSLLKIGSNDPKTTERLIAEFRKASTSMFAACVVDREQFDPLIAVTGSIRFAAISGTNYVDLLSISINSDERSQQWIKECLERKIIGFRFTEPVTARFSGEAKFTLE
jgi:hypothetical protein